ncbi:Tad domain-containing protein [Pseudarthrobacter sp. BRE9]|uniref:Tad domain-containing protein n=1 Tax=Pseudarthrobacter sp. BRE9 TaxID=2962582 RepID=UPI0028810A58|nr:Tad domain-containing protein [Pseudarthrobacter sp. BRE9]MDT0167851.1 Tad domain-containing protein [Pseudarthrobacter sp. BRE9]
MWRLIDRKSMNGPEHGAVSLIVAIMLVVLLGFAAIAVDVSMMYAERTQLRNGADAAALAIAQKCAKNTSDTDCSNTSSLAAGLANGNASDGLTNMKATALDLPNQSVTVTAGSQEAGKTPNHVSLFFARVLGISSAEVIATSKAQWGTPSKGPAILPLAIAYCKLDIPIGGTKGNEQVLDQSSPACNNKLPGGFGWITTPGTKCSVTMTAGQSGNSGIWFDSDPGASAPAICTTADFSQMNDQTVLLPLFDVATGTGTAVKYYVKGFAAFHVTGYHFANFNWSTGGNVQNKMIRGYFVKFVSLSQAFELGNVPNYGASIVRLTP